MTKAEIKEALKQGHKNLGLSEEAFDGVAALGETIGITEEQLANFVAGAKPTLVGFQSKEDKIRTLTKNEPTPNPTPTPEPTPTPTPTPTQGFSKEDLAQAIASAVASAVQPLQEKINGFEQTKATEDTVASVRASIGAMKIAKLYAPDLDIALKSALKVYNAGGCKMSAIELESEVTTTFNEIMSSRGVDPVAAMQGDNQGEDDDAVFEAELAAERKRKVDQGLISE